MANRSYLYTLNFDRSKRIKEESDIVNGLSECEYSIPISYKILVSQGVKKCNSIVWDNDKKIALIGNSDKGKIELILFLDNLRSKRLFDETILAKKIEETKTILADNLGFILLEAGEVFDMEEGELEMHNNKLFIEISRMNVAISKFYKEVMDINIKLDKLGETLSDLKASDDFLGKILFKLFSKNEMPMKDVILKCENAIYNLEKHKWNLLGIDYWSKALYHHFGNK